MPFFNKIRKNQIKTEGLKRYLVVQTMILAIFCFRFCDTVKAQPNTDILTLNVRKLGSDQGFEINGKKFKKRFSLSSLKSVLGTPDSVYYHKKVKGRCRSFGKGRVGCTFDKPAYVEVLYKRFGIWCSGPTDKSLLNFSIDLSQLKESPRVNFLLLVNSDTIHLENSLLDTAKINGLPFKDEFLLSSVLVDSSAIKVQNLIRFESFYADFQKKKTTFISRDRFLEINFDQFYRCMGLDLYLYNIGYNFR